MPVEVTSGDSPVVLGMPHTGTDMPVRIFDQLTPTGQTLGDTDWHIQRLYDGLLPGVTVVRATFHRYVIDANRDPKGTSLYPGQNTTGLVPMTNFDGEVLWYEPPDDVEIEARRRNYHVPYHEALSVELERIRALHGVAILYDCHSIRSEIPFLFEGVLPDFNIGTNIGITCDPAIESAVVGVCHRAEGYTSILNGRFKGGWSTRNHGHPSKGLHAIQMELAQSTHLEMEKPPFSYDLEKAESLRRHLRQVLESVQKIAFDLKEQS